MMRETICVSLRALAGKERLRRWSRFYYGNHVVSGCLIDITSLQGSTEECVLELLVLSTAWSSPWYLLFKGIFDPEYSFLLDLFFSLAFYHNSTKCSPLSLLLATFLHCQICQLSSPPNTCSFFFTF